MLFQHDYLLHALTGVDVRLVEMSMTNVQHVH